MTVEIGDTSFVALMNNLRQQIEMLKKRCIAAETALAEQKQANEDQQEKINLLQQANQEWADKYQHLQAGAINGTSPEEIEKLRSRYLAMIREIDLCLTKLNG